jgi:hypothetical protein
MPRRLDEVTRPVFSADGSRLLLATDRTSVKIWDTRTAACQATLEHPGPVLAAAFVPRTSQIVTGGAELRLWDSANTGRYSTLRGHAADVRVVAASADGTRLLSGGDDGSVKLWGLPDGREILSLRFTSEPIALAKYGLFDQYSEIGFALIAPPGSALAVATSPRRSLYTTPMVKLWRVTDWRLTREQLLERKRQDYLAWIATLPTDPRSSSAARAGKGSE